MGNANKNENNEKNKQIEIIYPNTEKPEKFTKQINIYKEEFNKYLEQIRSVQKSKEPQ